MKSRVPTWLLQVTWFIAGVFGTGAFWYYLSQNDMMRTSISAAGAVLFACIAIALHVQADSTHSSASSDELRQSRLVRIRTWRETIEALGPGFRDETKLKKFLSSLEYSTLRPNLSADVREKVERQRTAYVGGARGDDVRKYLLLDDVARIEREWGLA
jgi:hypothetical protein